MKMDIDHMTRSAGEASELLKALANRTRLMIVCQLLEGERAVGDLAAALELRDSTVSQHLALLRKDNIVATRRDGQTIYYGLARPEVRGILETLYRHFCR